MTETELSYAYCEQISKRSGSNFYRSFDLLTYDRRRGMNALYAFARLADDASDDPSMQAASNLIGDNKFEPHLWHAWIDHIYDHRPFNDTETTLRPVGNASADVVGSVEAKPITTPIAAQSAAVPSLEPIAAAVRDTVHRFRIDRECLHDIVRGVAMDETLRIRNWPDLRLYCERVASSVGLACLSIWSEPSDRSIPDSIRSAAIDCGIAFQLTNILRDVMEDARRGRVYFAEDELAFYGTSRSQWLESETASSNATRSSSLGDWRGLVRMTIERANALYERGWAVATSLPPDGRRMFSLMWHTYRELLRKIEAEPERIWQTRVSLTASVKARLLITHVITPLFQRQCEVRGLEAAHSIDQAACGAGLAQCRTDLIATLETETSATCDADARGIHSHSIAQPRVAVVGGGLAGINAAMLLARHGCKVDLFESKSRLGGRVGSFVDAASGQSIDYCQHVGMYCCSALRQWIDDVGQTPLWTEQDTLHFVAANGKHIPVRALPLPAPAHLAGLLLRWPQLSFMDRLQIGRAIASLYRSRVTESFSRQPAREWLQSQRQSERCIQNFWATILVSALGEQLDRVTMGPVRKVLIDGFAIHRRAFHLLVPSRPLSELTDQAARDVLAKRGVRVVLNHPVSRIINSEAGRLALDQLEDSYDQIIIATPWQKTTELLSSSDTLGDGVRGERDEVNRVAQLASQLQSSPITGVHTWWDRPWLKQPHAILIDRLCQWVFTAPHSSSNTDQLSAQPGRTHEHYYQIVISASRDLPKGDSEAVLKAIKRDLAEVFPESAVASLLRAKVVTDPNAVFSVGPGHEESRVQSGVLASCGIWLAGDWTETQWPATMEGALRSGAIAAQGVLSSLGRPAKLLPGD